MILDYSEYVTERGSKGIVNYVRVDNGAALFTHESTYYDLFEEVKNCKPSFEYIIRTMYKGTGNIEASFSSKMITTVDADMPIWDRNIMQNLCLELKGKTKEDQLDCAVRLYEQMLAWYGDFLKTENGRDYIIEFDKTLPGYTWMSEIKKIDFYLWSIRT